MIIEAEKSGGNSGKPSSKELERRLLRAAQNMAWMAGTTHHAYHSDRNAELSWRECDRGVCASMGHMLKMSGFDKFLNPTEVPV